MSFIDTIFDPVLNPIINYLGPLSGIIIISFIVALITTIIYKYATDQRLMKEYKDKLNDYQKQMKENRQDPVKLLDIQKSAMDINMKYMMQSFKPMFITFIPILIIFGWLAGNLAFEPIHPNTPFNTSILTKEGIGGLVTLNVPDKVKIMTLNPVEIKNNTAEWTIVAPSGAYIFEYNHNGTAYTKEVLVTENYDYLAPAKLLSENSLISKIEIKNDPLIAMKIFKWNLGWLGTYIIFSIVFSMLLRKILKLH